MLKNTIMIRVTLDINGYVISQFHAVRISGDTHPDTINEYRMDTGEIFEHRYGDGAAACAEKMCKIVKDWHLKPVPKTVDYDEDH